jgi:glycosyltransferase involved in cell wall biosynthesis
MLPSVTCVLPSGYGSKYVPLAIECFLQQTYEGPMELIILDNNQPGNTLEATLKALVNADDDRIKYFRCDRMPVGALRNLGNSYGTGEVIINWDEDDWYHSTRVAEQVARLQQSGLAVTGYHRICYWDVESEKSFHYLFEPRPIAHIPYACGGSQAYLRTWWEKHPYPKTGIEDYYFQKEARERKQLDSTDGRSVYVARAHKGSACPMAQYKGHKQFPEVSRENLPQDFFASIGETVSQ